MTGPQTTTRVGGLLAVIASLSLLWRESCENPVVFCYRIGWHWMERRRPAATHQGIPQVEGQCSSRSDSFSIFSTTSRD